MNNFWVINTSNFFYGSKIPKEYSNKFIEFMEEKHICLFGHIPEEIDYNTKYDDYYKSNASNDEKKKYKSGPGQRFKENINLNDVIIVSQRDNWKRESYFLGIVASDVYDYEIALTKECTIKELKEDKSNVADSDTVYKIQARKLEKFISLKNKKLTFKEDAESYISIRPIYKLNVSKDKILIEEILKIMGKNMKFFVISILLWKDEENNHDIKEFINTCKEEQKYIFFRNRQTDENKIPYKRDIEVLNYIKKDDIVFLRVRLNPSGVYKYYSFGKFINLENINSHELFNNYIQHKEEKFQLINMSNIITNLEGTKGKEENKRIFEISENEALNMAIAITEDDNFNFSNYTMKYWVISPNVLANKKEHPIKNFIDMMEKDKVALMGWKEDYPLGKKFENDVKLGDIIIISLRVNWERKDYFVGIVDSDSYHYDYQDRYIQARKLKYFVRIKEKISWNENCTNESIQSPPAIYELNENNEYDNKIMKEFLNILNIKMDNAMEKYINLLKENYNLILTGAPGTGKTYLAKQIAAKIIFNDDNKEYTEELEENEDFKNQCQFVQFHPSYDYTDFVEGLRPIKDISGNIGFERKDGVFKEFCKKALKNLIDSKKEVPELNYETIVKKYLIKFANEKYEEFNKNNELILTGMSNKPVAPFVYVEFDEDEILLMTAKSKYEYTINGKMDQYVEWYKTYKEKKEDGTLSTASMEKAVGFPGRITYLCAFLHNFDIKYNAQIEEELKNNTNTVEKVEKKNFVFIIDEINRGEISKIFGELFFAIDPGYRGIKGKVLTQYSNLIDEESEKYFYIPENVYIIGTMNDIDRSVESMDFAMRRRFAWKEVKAKNTQDMLDSMFDDNTAITNKDDIIKEAKGRMDNLNKAIEQIESFNSSYHIGASYFLKLKNYYNGGNIEEAFNSLWENHLKGLLFEYLRGMPDAVNKLEELKNTYNSDSANNTQTPNNQQSSIDTEKVNDGE
ncbi:AAA family ATPase [Brachyspira intermedia]|uniref:McrB family protein n=1 Tax=Brachyspira intermedia TaxID=84377 RepID=UPI0030053686